MTKILQYSADLKKKEVCINNTCVRNITNTNKQFIKVVLILGISCFIYNTISK